MSIKNPKTFKIQIYEKKNRKQTKMLYKTKAKSPISNSTLRRQKYQINSTLRAVGALKSKLFNAILQYWKCPSKCTTNIC